MKSKPFHFRLRILTSRFSKTNDGARFSNRRHQSGANKAFQEIKTLSNYFGSRGHQSSKSYGRKIWRTGLSAYKIWQHFKAEDRYEDAVTRLANDEVSGRLPNARPGDERDLIEGGFSTEMVGPYIGCFDGTPYFSGSDISLTILGGTGTAKTGSLGGPMTVGLGQGPSPESVVSISFKADLAWTTHIGRSALDGVPTKHFMPFSQCWEDQVTFNFFDDLIELAKRGQRISDRVRAKNSIIFGPVRKSNEMNSWITAIAEELSFLILAHRCELEPQEASPAAMADIANYTRKEMIAELDCLRESPACEGLIANMAQKFADDFSAADDSAAKEYRWVMQEYSKAWRLFQKGSPLRDSTMRTNFNLASLKERPRCLNLYFPPRYKLSHGSFIQLMLEYIIDTVAHAPGPVRVNLLCDEFGQYPRLDNALLCLRVYREMGMRMILLAQDLETFGAYAKDGGHKPFLNNTINLIWGQRDADMLRNLESRGGQRAHLIASANAEHARDGDRGGLSMAEHVTSVFPGDAIQQINHGRMLLDAPGTRLTPMHRPMFWDLPFAAPHILNFNEHPIPDLND
ncbi:MAG: type IV secretory system conjugative DNA transfer family protein [Pseudomonadota bacterium]